MADHAIPRDRCDYSAIVDRPPLKLPGGARVVVWTIVNLEVWDIAKPMARQVLPAPTGQPLQPDVPNWSWHEYGMRVGVWRFFDLYRRLGLQPSLSVNARVCEDYPRVAQEAKDLGWEFMGHSYEQGPIHREPDQRAMIHRSLDVLEKFTGKRPVGWLGPGLTQTLDTPELLAEAGIKYIGDWVYDDEPTPQHRRQPLRHQPGTEPARKPQPVRVRVPERAVGPGPGGRGRGRHRVPPEGGTERQRSRADRARAQEIAPAEECPMTSHRRFTAAAAPTASRTPK